MLTRTVLLPFLLMLSLLVSGCAPPFPIPDPEQRRAEESALVQATLADQARAERFMALLDERDRLIGETRTLFEQYRREMKSLNAEYDASREVLLEMIDYYNRERASKQLAFIDLISKMKRETTADEWAVIAEFQLRHFNPRRNCTSPPSKRSQTLPSQP